MTKLKLENNFKKFIEDAEITNVHINKLLMIFAKYID